MREAAVVGNGRIIRGLIAAQLLAKNGVQVVFYDHNKEEEESVNFDGVDLDVTSFTLFHQVVSTDMMELIDSLGVDIEKLDMSFSVSLLGNGGKDYEWSTRNGISSLFAQKKNLLNPYFWQMLRDVLKFKIDTFRLIE